MKNIFGLLLILSTVSVFADTIYIPDATALSKVYSKTSSETATWKITAEEIVLMKDRFTNVEEGDLFECSVKKQYEYNGKENKSEVIVVFSCEPKSEVGNGCHACSPITGVAYFRDQEVVAVNKALHTAGTWGIAAHADFYQMGDNLYGIVFTAVWAGMGTKSSNFLIAGPIEKDVKLLGTVEGASGSNLYDCQKNSCYAFESQVKFERPKKNGSFFDLKVIKAGNEISKSGRPVVVQEIKTYPFVNNAYKIENK